MTILSLHPPFSLAQFFQQRPSSLVWAYLRNCRTPPWCQRFYLSNWSFSCYRTQKKWNQVICKKSIRNYSEDMFPGLYIIYKSSPTPYINIYMSVSIFRILIYLWAGTIIESYYYIWLVQVTVFGYTSHQWRSTFQSLQAKNYYNTIYWHYQELRS